MGNSFCLPRTWRTWSAYPTARNDPAQQRRHEKRACARSTAIAGAAANEDATAKEGPKERVDNAVETYAGKVRVSAAGMRSG